MTESQHVLASYTVAIARETAVVLTPLIKHPQMEAKTCEISSQEIRARETRDRTILIMHNHKSIVKLIKVTGY